MCLFWIIWMPHENQITPCDFSVPLCFYIKINLAVKKKKKKQMTPQHDNQVKV